MECSFTKQAEHGRSGPCIQQPKPDFFTSETCGPNQRRFALTILVKVQIRASFNERVDQRQLLAFFQGASKEHIRDGVQGMRDALAPEDKLVRARWTLGEQTP